jgi:hypothetical protein
VLVGGLVANGFVGPAFPGEHHMPGFNGLGQARRRGDSDELAEKLPAEHAVVIQLLRPSNSVTPPPSTRPARSSPVPPEDTSRVLAILTRDGRQRGPQAFDPSRLGRSVGYLSLEETHRVAGVVVLADINQLRDWLGVRRLQRGRVLQVR